MGQTVLDRGEMDLANGVWFTVRHAPRAEWGPLTLKKLPFLDEIIKIAYELAAIRHMTLSWVLECVIGLVLLEKAAKKYIKIILCIQRA